MPIRSPLAGKPAPVDLLVDVAALLAAYHDERPDSADPGQRIVFGTSGHRGSALNRSFNEWHVLAIAEAICRYRSGEGITGPLFLGVDTHAVSAPACASALEVLAAHGVDVMLAVDDEFTPTPAVSHAIIVHNRGRDGSGGGLADGIVITPSHNPPQDGGFKYNPPHGGPAGSAATKWIENEANRLLEDGLREVRRIPHAQALKAATTHRFDFIDHYVGDLGSIVDLQAIAGSGIRMGVDPLGGAGVHYWPVIAERYRLDLTVVSDVVDPTFGFMTVDNDGRIRMDPSSASAMQRLLALKDRFDIAFACDPDHDRHGIVTPHHGLLPPNHYLSAAVDYLFAHRPAWGPEVGVGKSVVTTRVLDVVARKHGRPLQEMPVGFKWFVPGLMDGSLGVACEESAGATFLRHDGTVWTTDKDGIVAALLAAEMTVRTGRDPGTSYGLLAESCGNPVAARRETPARPAQMVLLGKLAPAQVLATELAGDRIDLVIDRAPGNDQAIGGIKVGTASGWFAARPSGTEPLYKIYAESFRGAEHLERLLSEAQALVDAALAPVGAAVP